MSTSNFYSMDNFPLYVVCNSDFTYEDEETGEEIFEEIFVYDFIENVESELEKINDDLLFHKITLKSGYYDGIQLYIETLHDDLEDMEKYWNNEDTKYQFDMCKSLTLRKFKTEINKVNRILKKIAEENGMTKLGVVGRFSNGETVYTKIA